MRGLFGALAERKAATIDWLPDFLFSPAAKSGQSVNVTTALQVTAILACCRVMGEGIAQSPCRLLKPRPNGRGSDVAVEHPLHRKLHRRPNGWQTAFEFWETVVLHLALLKNAYVFISRGAGDRILELIILDPLKVTPKRGADLKLFYDVTGDDGLIRRFDQTLIWHLRGLSWNGWSGLETIKLAREAIGLSLALEEAHARLHANGVQPSGVYSVEGGLTEPQHAQLTGWLKKHASGENRGAPLVLDRAAKWLSQQMTGVDAQHVETRNLQIGEACRAMGVMPIMIGLADKTATYASAEQMFLAHEVHTLAPLAARIEQSAEAALLTEVEADQGYAVKFYLQALRRGDYKGRQEGLQIQRRNGVINANEWRDLEDMNPREDAGGDQYIVEANMALQDGRDLPPPKAPAEPARAAA